MWLIRKGKPDNTLSDRVTELERAMAIQNRTILDLVPEIKALQNYSRAMNRSFSRVIDWVETDDLPDSLKAGLTVENLDSFIRQQLSEEISKIEIGGSENA